MNTSDKTDQIPIDFSAVCEFVSVPGTHSLHANAITSWRNKVHSQETGKFFSVHHIFMIKITTFFHCKMKKKSS